MKTGLFFRAFLIIGLLCSFELLSAPFDTGMKTFYQPNNTSFVGRIWGDEFIYWAETESGYNFVRSVDGWYYYATLDEIGEYTPTEYKVGIDTPPEYSYQLTRSTERLESINELIEQSLEQIEANKQWYEQKQIEADASSQPVTIKVGIILIEFTDVTRHISTTRPTGYYKTDFDSMMFSYNYWNDAQRHPEEEEIFGSFSDYWDQMSCGKLKIEGRVVNPPDVNGVPQWLHADTTKEYYATLTLGPQLDSLSDEAITKALDSNYIDTTNSSADNYYDKLVVVYAEKAHLGGALSVNGHMFGGKYILLGELSSWKLYWGDVWTFTHIGVYAHEFAHNLGFYDEYFDYHPEESVLMDGNGTDIFNFCLMARGIYNGPLEKGECPATVSAYYRIQKNWITPITLSSDQEDFLVEYNYENPNVYKIRPTADTSLVAEHYLFEAKKRQGFDLFIPGSPTDTTFQSGRLLIWHNDINPAPYYDLLIDRITVKPADNLIDEDSQLQDFFPLNYPQHQDFNDTTSPGTTLGRVYWPSPLVTNERPAHFALNGIQRLSDGNTLIKEIRLNYQIVSHSNSGNWQTVSVPVYTDNDALQSIFPSASVAYHFANGSYIQDTVLSPGIGYFTLFPSSPQTLIVGGTPVEHLTIPVSNGWTTIGTIFDEIAFSNVCTDPPGIIQIIYSYDNGYHYLSEDDSLKPLVGYWVLTSSAGDIIIDKDSEGCEIEKVTTVQTIDFSSLDKFTITDANGFSQSLFVSNINRDTALTNMNLDLPPMFPEINFDSRFEFNEFVKKVSADSGTIDLNILVQTIAFPITLSWELNPENGINYSFISDSVQGKLSTIMSKSGDISFTSLSDNKIKLWASTDYLNPMVDHPTEYALQQNYPNPFNPTTVINYQIPKDGLVTIKVYDILGKEVTTLVNENKSIGRYSVQFDGSNLASGVYIYRINSGDFVSSKKMMLIK